MDPTLNLDPHHRLHMLRSVRAWRSAHSWRLRAATLLATLVAFVAACLLAVGTVQARVDIEFDPMRPGVAPGVSAHAATAAGADAPSATPTGVPTLRITRMNAPGTANAGVLSALVDDTWVRRGDVVAGYRVTALRHESIDLVNVAEPTLRLTLRLNPVSVERTESAQAAEKSPGRPRSSHSPRGEVVMAPPPPGGGLDTLPSWAPLALEKKP